MTGIGLQTEEFGTHSLRRTETSIIYKATSNLRAVQIPFGHGKIESTVRYLGVDAEDILARWKRAKFEVCVDPYADGHGAVSASQNQTFIQRPLAAELAVQVTRPSDPPTLPRSR